MTVCRGVVENSHFIQNKINETKTLIVELRVDTNNISLTPSPTTPILFTFPEAYFLENSLQPSEQDVPIEEFFWTGSGDGPSYSQPKESSHPSKYPNTVIRTATILATVYIDANNDFDQLCGFNCDDKVKWIHSRA